MGLLRHALAAAQRACRKNEFGVRRLTVPFLALLRHAGPRRVRLGGKPIEIVAPFWAVNDFREIFFDQIYRFPSASEAPVVIDCGANVGQSVIYFKLLHPRSRVIAFEPDPTVFKLLQKNVETFGLEGVELIPKAVSTENGTRSFRSDGGVGGRLMDGEEQGSASVDTVRLRDYLAEPIDFLKLDIEGAEHDVLHDCRDLLRNVNCLFVEFHGDPNRRQCLDEVLALMSAAGFRYYIKEAREERRPFERAWRWSTFDLQLNLFCVRE